MGIEAAHLLHGKFYRRIGSNGQGKFTPEEDGVFRSMQQEWDDFEAGKLTDPRLRWDTGLSMGFLLWQENEAERREYEASLENPEAYPHLWEPANFRM